MLAGEYTIYSKFTFGIFVETVKISQVTSYLACQWVLPGFGEISNLNLSGISLSASPAGGDYRDFVSFTVVD